MQEKWQHMKIPPAWKPDEWICHHSGNRESTIMDDYYHHQSNRKSATASRNFGTPMSSKRISTAELRRRKYFYVKTYFKYSSFFLFFINYRNRKFEFEKCAVSSFFTQIKS